MKSETLAQEIHCKNKDVGKRVKGIRPTHFTNILTVVNGIVISGTTLNNSTQPASIGLKIGC